MDAIKVNLFDRKEGLLDYSEITGNGYTTTPVATWQA